MEPWQWSVIARKWQIKDDKLCLLKVQEPQPSKKNWACCVLSGPLLSFEQPGSKQPQQARAGLPIVAADQTGHSALPLPQHSFLVKYLRI